ncbi:MAG: DUF1902 domain-containing protein [Pseudomonadota bacterium]
MGWKLKRSIRVATQWNAETGFWVANSQDLAGLAVEARTQTELKQKIQAAVFDLIELYECSR